MIELRWQGDERLRTAAATDARWLVHAQLWRPLDPDQVVTGAHETAAILLHGTFDLVGGGTAWPARGARRDPCVGRPMAVYLPPDTAFRCANGSGEILLLAARQPAAPPPATGRELLAQKPLLPLAGSGKSFDPTSGEWRPAETFPDAPESLPPRRFERLAAGSCTIERVFAPDYKAATLCVDEVVVPPAATFALADVPARPACDEILLFVRGSGARVAAPGTTAVGDGDVALLCAGSAGDVVVTAASTCPCYVVVAWAGKPWLRR